MLWYGSPGGPTLLQEIAGGLRRTAIRLAVSGTFFAGAFTSQCLLDSFLLTRFQVESVTLDIFNDVLLQDLSLKALQRALQAFTIMKLNFSQRNSPHFFASSFTL